MKKILTIIFIIFAGKLAVIGQVPVWFLKMNQIQIFKSNKLDVETVFENPKIIYSTADNPKEKGWGEILEYETKQGILEVFYSSGKCKNNNKGWNVDKDIVVSLEFKPTEPVSLSKFGLDLSTFSRYKESDTQYYQYTSSELGIEFSTLGGNLTDNLTSIEISLTPEMEKLDCKNFLKEK